MPIDTQGIHMGPTALDLRKKPVTSKFTIWCARSPLFAAAAGKENHFNAAICRKYSSVETF